MGPFKRNIQKKGKFIEAESRLVVVWGWGRNKDALQMDRRGVLGGRGREEMLPDLETWPLPPIPPHNVLSEHPVHFP